MPRGGWRDTPALREEMLNTFGRMPVRSRVVFERTTEVWGAVCERRLYRALHWLVESGCVVVAGHEECSDVPGRFDVLVYKSTGVRVPFGTKIERRKGHANTSPERQVRGERAGGAKLCPADVVVIRGMLRDGATLVDTARKFGVWPSCIGRIAHGETWRHILQEAA